MLSILFLFQQVVIATNVTEELQIVVTENPKTEEILPMQDKTIDRLVEQQTDLIKKIIAGHKASTIEYPTVTNKETEVKEDYHKLKQEKEQQSIEDLQKRCQLLLKSLNINETVERTTETNKIATVEAFGPAIKPQFLQKSTPKPTIPIKLGNMVTEQTSHKTAPHYFIMTYDQSRTTQKPQAVSSTQYPLQSNIKYVQLEPVILQKMVLNNGKMLYYWFRSIPTFSQHNDEQRQSYPTAFPQPVENKETVQEHLVNKEATSETIPNYEIEYGAQKQDQNMYRQHMKFVLPIKPPKEGESDVTQNSWRIDPYAYYPKTLQPTMVNIRVPYNPYFHMIKTLTFPESAIKS